MRRWGVRHLFVWTETTRAYLARSGHFVERWRGGRWSHFELADADLRSVVTTSGSGARRNLDFLGGEVALVDASAGEPIVVRANYYPAWRAFLEGQAVPLYSANGQLAFRAPRAGTYVVQLKYPRYGWLTLIAITSITIGTICLPGWPDSRPS
jgi:hypothetical protein